MIRPQVEYDQSAQSYLDGEVPQDYGLDSLSGNSFPRSTEEKPIFTYDESKVSSESQRSYDRF